MKKIIRYENIDALRGVAAIMVMILHVYNAFIRIEDIQRASSMPLNLFAYFDIGRMGITIFFLISGYVIGRSIMSYEDNAIKTFCIRRIFRLYPLFWFSMIMAILIIWIPKGIHFNLLTIVANATMLPAWFQQPFFLGLYWTLETELIFYFLIIIIFATTKLQYVSLNIAITLVLFAISAGFVLFPNFSPDKAHWMATPFHLSLMFLGLTWREFFENKHSPKIKKFNRIHTTLLLSVPIFFIAVSLIKNSDLNLSDSIAYLLGIFIFYIGINFWKKPHSIFLFLGKISFSIYLLHPIVFGLILRGYKVGNWKLTDNVFFYLILCSSITIIISYLTYKLIEKPFNNFGRNNYLTK